MYRQKGDAMITSAQARRNMQNGEGVSLLTNVALRYIEFKIDADSSAGKGFFEMSLEEFTDCVFKKGILNNVAVYYWYNIPNRQIVLPAEVCGKTFEQIIDSSLSYDETKGTTFFKEESFWAKILKNVSIELIAKPRAFDVSIISKEDSKMYLHVAWEKN